MSSHTICHKVILSKKVSLPNGQVGTNVAKNLEKFLAHQHEGRCINEGFVIKGSTKVIGVSTGVISNGKLTFGVQYECMICLPVRDMILDDCVIDSVVTAGIEASYKVNGESVLKVYITRDNNYDNSDFNNYKPTDIGKKIKAKVIGCIYELNEREISTICDLYVGE
jgi:DNA-directed RNA polymerase subunit E'/Rpb7